MRRIRQSFGTLRLAAYVQATCWVCIYCAAGSVSLRQHRSSGFGGSRTQGRALLELSTAYVYNAAEFVAAVADQSVGRVCIAAPELSIPPSAWDDAGALQPPILVSRDLTIEGDPGLAEWPTIEFNHAKAKIRLAGNVTILFRHLFYPNACDNPTRAPDLDIMAPTLPGPPAFMLFGPAFGTFGVCFPSNVQVIDFSGLLRPIERPGNNTVQVGMSQAGCVDDISAPPLRRCWAGRVFIEDFASYCAEVDDLTDSVAPTNKIFNILNCTVLCETVVDENCLSVQGKEPLVCFKEAERRYAQLRAAAAVSGGGGPRPSSSLPAAGGGGSSSSSWGSAYDTRTTGGLTGSARIAVICVATLSGTLTVIALMAAVVARIRRRAPGAAAAAAAAGPTACGGGEGNGRRQQTWQIQRNFISSDELKQRDYYGTGSGGSSSDMAGLEPGWPASSSSAAAAAGDAAGCGGGGCGGASAERKPYKDGKGGGGGFPSVRPGGPSAAAAGKIAAGREPPASAAHVADSAYNQAASNGAAVHQHMQQQQQRPNVVPDVVITPLTRPRADLALDVVLLEAASAPLHPEEEWLRATRRSPHPAETLPPPPPSTAAPPDAPDAAAAPPPPPPPPQQQRPEARMAAAELRRGSTEVVGKLPPAGADDCSAASSEDFATVQSSSIAADVSLSDQAARTNGGGSSGNGGGGGGGGDPPLVKLLHVTLGKGSFGRVVEGLFGGRRVAVKLMASEEGPWGGGGRGGGPQQREQQQEEQQQQQFPAAADGHYSNAFVQSFVQEVQVLSRVQHPNVVRLLAACVTPPRLCLVMELMETSLERLLHGKRGGGACEGGGGGGGEGDASNKTKRQQQELMPLDKVLRIGIHIANALAYLHPTIVHRDLKPANVLLNDAASDRPVVKLTDFGLSRLRVTVASTKNLESGTPPYMAPECFDVENTCITHKSDIYALGVLLWEMLSGERPWSGIGPVAIAFTVTYQGRRLPLGALCDSSRCPPKLSRLLEACWDPDPDRRPAAAEAAKQMALVLEAFVQQLNGAVTT